uniref:Torsin-1A C-terminal domain-containing protein n=1 Tax=Ciona savignyi TaxID=51511 RepID=H2Y5F7_CIOSA
MVKLFRCVLFVCLVVKCTAFLDPISTGFFVTTAASSTFFMLAEITGLTSLRCKINFMECCNKHHIKPNFTGLEYDLKNKLYGQDLVFTTVLRSVKSHIENPNPSKALVMSFHGWTGSGKNYVTQMIVNNLYVKKLRSSFVHVFNAEVDFKHQSQLQHYKDQLQIWLHGNVTKCGKSIFIFDEMDHMPEGLVDAVKPYLGNNPSIHGVDYRKCIFIFLSNTGGKEINKKCLETWRSGYSRSTIKLSDMQELLERVAFNDKSGFRLSGIVEKNLIDHFVPFFPLEREHVEKCIKDEIKKLNLKRQILSSEVNEIMDELQWIPTDLRLYSKSGCKRIAQKVGLVLAT